MLLASSLAVGYEVPVSDADYDRQICSGMWGGDNTFINGARVPVRRSYISGLNGIYSVTFDSTSQGQLAMVIYEWKDMAYLGKVTSQDDEYMPVSRPSRIPVYARDANGCSRRPTSVHQTLYEEASVTTRN